jgi:hypothetical protein
MFALVHQGKSVFPKVAKAIIAEKKGVELLQKFDDEKAAYFARKKAVAQVREERQREIRYQALASKEQMNSITHRMQVEERNQVKAMIRDSATRKAEQKKTEAEKFNQRQHLAQARKVFEEKWMQEYKQKEAERVAAIARKIEERDEARVEGRKRREEEEKAAKEEAAKNNPALREKTKPVVAVNKRLSREVTLENPTQARYEKAERLRTERLAALQCGLQEKAAAASDVKEKKKAREEEWHLSVVEECQKHMGRDNATRIREEKAAELKERFEQSEVHRSTVHEKRQKDMAKYEQDLFAKIEAKDSKPRYASYVYARME